MFETDTTAVVHGMLDALHGLTPPQAVRRYQLTPEGTKYFKQIPGAFGSTNALCYGHKTVDTILHWTTPATLSGTTQTEVTYTYKVTDLAPWTKLPEVQNAFPDIATTLSGVSKTARIETLQLTNQGWELPTP